MKCQLSIWRRLESKKFHYFILLSSNGTDFYQKQLLCLCFLIDMEVMWNKVNQSLGDIYWNGGGKNSWNQEE